MRGMLLNRFMFGFIIIAFTICLSYSAQWEVFTSKNDVQDIALTDTTLWAATSGGVVAWNLNDNSYTTYTTIDGLSSCNVSHIAIDKKGRTWIATKKPTGLFVYEHNAWEQIYVGGTDHEIGDKIIADLETDRFGNVWVHTKNETEWYVTDTVYYSDGIIPGMYLWRYDGHAWYKHHGLWGPMALDPQKNLLAVDSLFYSQITTVGQLQFRIVSFNGSEFVCKWRRKIDDRLIFPALAHIAQDSKGNPWISYFDERHGETYGVICNNTLYNTLDGLADDNVRSITADASGPVWCATDGGISKFNGTSWETYDTTKGVASNLVYKILIDSNNTIYAATSKGISILRSNEWKILNTINEPSHNSYTDMITDKKGGVFFAGNNHLARYDTEQWNIYHFGSIRFIESEFRPFPRLGYANYKSYSNCKSFIKSNDGTIYAIGNERKKGHILKQPTHGSVFVKACSSTLEENNQILSPAVASSIYDYSFWLTGYRGTLISLSKQAAVMHPPALFNFDDNAIITSMLLDRDGKSVWVGYHSSYSDLAGIVHFDGDTILKRLTESDGLVSNQIFAIARDSLENLWFASGSKGQDGPGGVTILSNSSLTKYLKDSDGKMFGSCNVLFVDRNGFVWIYADNGIVRFDGSSWKLFDSTTVSPDLSYVRYSHITQDKSGTVWFGTEGSGILAYKDNRWSQFTTRDGLPYNNIRRCAIDHKDNLWILTDNGIAKRNSGGIVHNQAQRNFLNQSNNKIIKQIGKQYYVSPNTTPNKIYYTLFDIRGRVIHSQTLHHKNSFAIPEKRYGSGLRILSITLENPDKSQNNYVIKMKDIK
jgi:ligand-binding sensor domain-containing protein